jgi:hypothetical protein
MIDRHPVADLGQAPPGLMRLPSAHPPPGAEAADAVAELDEVEASLGAVREQKRRLELSETRLWGRRNELEQRLIHLLGSEWWREHARHPHPNGATPQPAAAGPDAARAETHQPEDRREHAAPSSR